MSVAHKFPNQTVRQVLAKSAEGYPLLGWAGFWSVTNFKDSQANVLAIVESLGFSSACVPQVRAKSAFIRAVEEVAHAHNAKHIKVKDDSAVCAYLIVSTVVDPGNLDATFTTETKAILHKGSETLRVEGPNEEEIRTAYEDFKNNYYSDQFRDVVLNILSTHTDFVTVRDRGGVYFIPSTDESTYEKIQALFLSYPGCSFDVIPVIDTAGAKKSMWKSLIGEVTEEIKKLKEDVSNLEKDPSERSVRLRVEQYKKLKEKVENYEILLSGTAEDLKSDIESVQAALSAKVTG